MYLCVLVYTYILTVHNIYLNRENSTLFALAKTSLSTSLLHFMKATAFYSQEECIDFHFYFDKNKKLVKIFLVDIFFNQAFFCFLHSQ